VANKFKNNSETSILDYEESYCIRLFFLLLEKLDLERLKAGGKGDDRG